MRKLRQLMLLMVCLCLYIPAKAEAGQMVATTKDGKKVTVDLTSGMQGVAWAEKIDNELTYSISVYTGQVKYEGNRPVAQEGGKIWFEMQISNISNIDFTGLASVGRLQADDGIAVDVAGGKVKVSGVTEPVTATIYSLDGIERDRITLTHDAVIDLNLYGAGMHIVKVGSATFKILTK